MDQRKLFFSCCSFQRVILDVQRFYVCGNPGKVVELENEFCRLENVLENDEIYEKVLRFFLI